MVLGTFVAMWAGPGSAHAGSVTINCGLLAPGQSCLTNVRHSYTLVVPRYYGPNPIFISGKVILDSTGANYAYAYGFESSNLGGLNLALGIPPLTKPLVVNNSSVAHTVTGTAYY